MSLVNFLKIWTIKNIYIYYIKYIMLNIFYIYVTYKYISINYV